MTNPTDDLKKLLKNADLLKKAKVFNLLPVNQNMVLYLEEYSPKQRDVQCWDYVKFFQGQPYFYSQAYIESHTIDELIYSFAQLTND